MIVESPHLFSFSNDTFIDLFNGGSVPRNAFFPSSLNFTTWTFLLFDPAIAYPLLRLIYSILAFLGMGVIFMTPE